MHGLSIVLARFSVHRSSAWICFTTTNHFIIGMLAVGIRSMVSLYHPRLIVIKWAEVLSDFAGCATTTTLARHGYTLSH